MSNLLDLVNTATDHHGEHHKHTSYRGMVFLVERTELETKSLGTETMNDLAVVVRHDHGHFVRVFMLDSMHAPPKAGSTAKHL